MGSGVAIGRLNAQRWPLVTEAADAVGFNFDLVSLPEYLILSATISGSQTASGPPTGRPVAAGLP